MKTLLLFLLTPFVFFVHAQTPDTAAIRVEIDSLIKLNRSLIAQQKAGEASPVIHQAEEKCLAAFGEATALYGLIAFNKGRTLYYSGDNAGAEKCYIIAKDIQEKTIGKNHPDYAWSINNLASIYSFAGQYEKAEALFLEAKAIREQVLGKDHPDLASSLDGLAVVNSGLGRYEKAEPLYLASKAIREKVLGNEHPHYAISLNNIANLYKSLGAYEKSELLYLEAETVWKKVLGTDHPYYAASLNNLAELYSMMGNYEKAEPLFLASKEIREKAFGKEHTEYATSLINLANLYKDMGDYEKAEPWFLESSAIWKKVFSNEHPLYATSLNSLANLYMVMDQNEKAEPLFLEAKTIQEKVLGKEHPKYAANLNQLAMLYTKTGKYKKAQPLYLEAQSILEKAVGKEHPSYASSLNNLADLYILEGQANEAAPLYAQANELRKKQLIKASSHLSERELLNFTQTFTAGQNQFLSFSQTQLGLLGSAYDNSLFYKGFLLTANKKVRRLAQTDTSSAELFLRLKSYNRRLAKEYSKPLAERDSLSIAAVEEKANSLEKELARSIAGFGETLRQVSWQDVQNALKPNEAAIEFVDYTFYHPHPTDSIMYAALLLRPGDQQPQFIPLFEAKSIDSLLIIHQDRRADYVNDLYSFNERGLNVEEKPVKTLYELIWQPLEKELAGMQTIYFSPSGLLHRVNLNAIPAGDEKTIADLFHLVQLNSTRSLVINREEIAKNQQAVLYGGIQYESDTAALLFAIENYSDDALIASRGAKNSIDTTARGGSWDFLKWTKKEVESINPILQKADFEVKMFSDYSATEESFRAIGQRALSPQILHLATHGFFFPDPDTKPSNSDQLIFKTSDHPMIRSGLILAGGNHVWQGNASLGNLEDGILTAYEISQMDLSNTELVVLSACETGLGDIEGNEGVYGLQRAFKIAGAKYLIMSLWQVPDRQTKDFMVTFYQHCLPDRQAGLEVKMSIPDAFRKTQQEMKARFYDPYMWAGFVLVE